MLNVELVLQNLSASLRTWRVALLAAVNWGLLSQCPAGYTHSMYHTRGERSQRPHGVHVPVKTMPWPVHKKISFCAYAWWVWDSLLCIQQREYVVMWFQITCCAQLWPLQISRFFDYIFDTFIFHFLVSLNPTLETATEHTTRWDGFVKGCSKIQQ